MPTSNAMDPEIARQKRYSHDHNDLLEEQEILKGGSLSDKFVRTYWDSIHRIESFFHTGTRSSFHGNPTAVHEDAESHSYLEEDTVAVNDVIAATLNNPGYPNVWRFLCALSIGIIVGLVDFCLTEVVEGGIEMHMEYTITSFDGKHGVKSPWMAWLAYVGIGLGCVTISTLAIMWQPLAVASGIPTVIGFLNGAIKFTCNVPLFSAKFIATAFTVPSGLFLGREGPIVYLGALVGSAVCKMFNTIQCWVYKQLEIKMVPKHFSSDTMQRDFTAVGAGAGLAAACHAPIAGVFFVIEEAGSFFSVASMELTFAAALSAYWTLWTFDGFPLHFVKFETPVGENCTTFDAIDCLAFFVVALFGGFLGAGFNAIAEHAVLLRSKYVKSRARQVADVFFAVVVAGTIAIFAVLNWECRDASRAILFRDSGTCMSRFYYDQITVGRVSVAYAWDAISGDKILKDLKEGKYASGTKHKSFIEVKCMNIQTNGRGIYAEMLTQESKGRRLSNTANNDLNSTFDIDYFFDEDNHVRLLSGESKHPPKHSSEHSSKHTSKHQQTIVEKHKPIDSDCIKLYAEINAKMAKESENHEEHEDHEDHEECNPKRLSLEEQGVNLNSHHLHIFAGILHAKQKICNSSPQHHRRLSGHESHSIMIPYDELCKDGMDGFKHSQKVMVHLPHLKQSCSSNAYEFEHEENRVVKFDQHLSIGCDKKKEFNELAMLFLSGNLHSVRVLLLRGIPHLLSLPCLLVFAFVSFLLSATSLGLPVSGGTVIPMMMVGGAFGRAVGVIMLVIHKEICKYAFSDPHGNMFYWSMGSSPIINLCSISDPSIYAAIGCAAFMGGSGRITLFLAIVLLEMTQDIKLTVPIGFTTIIAMYVGNVFNHGLYHRLCHLWGMPMISPAAEQISKLIPVKWIMATPVVSLDKRASVGDLLDMFSKYTHNAFPVCDDHGTLFGLLSKKQVIDHIDQKLCNLSVREKHEKILNLANLMELCPITVRSHMKVARVHTMMISLGLRHIIVIDTNSRVVGIVTRKDIQLHHIKKAIKSHKDEVYNFVDNPVLSKEVGESNRSETLL